MTYSDETSFHEPGGRDQDGDVARSAHSAWQASRQGHDVSVLSIVYPYPGEASGPTVAASDGEIVLTDGTRRAVATIQIDGRLLLVESEAGTETLRYAERGSDLQMAQLSGSGRFVESRAAEAVEWYLSPTPQTVSIEDVPFEPTTLDGACSMLSDGERLTIRTGGPRFGVRAADANGRPAALISPIEQANVGQPVLVDGSGSCDPEGGVLTFQWSLKAAPAGSRWPIADSRLAGATLTPDVAGVYRLALQVTDSQGATSDPAFLSLEVEEP